LGATLVEFAFVLPLLLTLLLGIVWTGRAFNIYQTITRAAREGARYAVLPSCASCGNATVDLYSGSACLGTESEVFTGYIAPSLSASNIDPTQIPASGVGAYCQKAVWLEGTTNPRQCGVQISFKYPLQLTIPFTSLNATTINIPTSVQMRLENQSLDTSGNPTCP
jgi:hypothetical protein